MEKHIRQIGQGFSKTVGDKLAPTGAPGCTREHVHIPELQNPLYDARERAFVCDVWRWLNEPDRTGWRQVGRVVMRPLCPKPFIDGAAVNYTPKEECA
jgi:hypothetical protein